MTARALTGLAGLGSAALLAGALAFQFIGGLAPCPMCIWQRWPHAIAVLLAVVATTLPRQTRPRQTRPVASLGVLVMLVSAGLGAFHAGVEQGWWEGPSTCVGGPVEGLSTDELLDRIMSAPLVRCDEIVWDLLGVTMAGWNAILSLVLAGLWASVAARREA